MKTIIFDIDGTLADITHRLQYVKNKDYEKFFELMPKDKPRKTEQTLIKILAKEFKTILLTGRPEVYRTKTETWLKKHKIPYDNLIMRPIEHYSTHDSQWKANEVRKIETQGHKVIAIFEDRQSVVNELRTHGYTVLQTNAWKEGNGITGAEKDE